MINNSAWTFIYYMVYYVKNPAPNAKQYNLLSKATRLGGGYWDTDMR